MKDTKAQTTHWAGCAEAHHDCAIELMDHYREGLRSAREFISASLGPQEPKTGTEPRASDAQIAPGFYDSMELCYKPEVEKDRKDAERLNWLEKNQRSLNIVTVERRKPRTDGTRRYDSWMEFLGWSADLSDPFEYGTVREAIDKAMEQSAVPSSATEQGQVAPEGLNSQGMSGETMPDGA